MSDSERAGDRPAREAGAPAILVLLLLGFSVFQVHRATAPLREGDFGAGFAAQNAARYAQAGRNYLREGFRAHLFAPSFHAGARPGTEEAQRRALYLHHPPGAPLLVGASFAIRGESEAAAWLPFLLLGALVPLALFLIGRSFWSAGAGAFAACLYAAAPMTALYGAHVDPQGPALLVPLLLATFFFARYARSRAKRDLALLLSSLLAAMVVDWPAVIAAGLMPLFMAKAVRRGEKGILLAPCAAVLFAAAYVAWVTRLGRSLGGALLESAEVRGFGALLRAGDPLERIAGIASGFAQLASWPLLALALLGAALSVRDRRERDRAGFLRAVSLLVAVGALHVVLFPFGAVVHDYWTYLLIPPLALLGGAALESVRRGVAAWQGVGFSVLVGLAACAGTVYAGDRVARARIEMLGADPQFSLLPALGRIVREQTRPEQRLLTNLPVNPGGTAQLVLPSFTWYADRAVRGDVRTVEDLERAFAEEGRFDLYVYFPTDPAPPILKSLFEGDPQHKRLDIPMPRDAPVPAVRLFLFRLKAP